MSTATGPSKSTSLERQIHRLIRWIQEHQERFWAIVGLFAAVTFVALFSVQHRQRINDEAWLQLGSVQNQLMQNQLSQAKKSLDEWKTKYRASSASNYAQFIEGDLLYKTSDYATAAQVYGSVAAGGRPAEIRQLALAAQSSAEEMAGRYPQALAAARTFTDKYPDHFFAASMYLTQARLSELTNDPAAAKAVYERFTVLYPQSPWTEFVRGRIQALGGTLPTPSQPSSQP
jgi:outer membrane protein assembly factor BamD (BamD/ComL family)